MKKIISLCLSMVLMFTLISVISTVPASAATKPVIYHWISAEEMGDTVQSGIQGTKYYVCFDIIDEYTGKRYNEVAGNISYTVSVNIYTPKDYYDYGYMFNNADSAWVSDLFGEAGTWSYTIVISGDLDGTFTGKFDVAANPLTINTESNTLNVNTAKFITTIGMTGYFSSEYYLSFSFDSPNINCRVGEWDGNNVPILISAIKTGTYTMTIEAKSSAINMLITTKKVTVNVTSTATLGDVDGSGNVEATDALYALQCSVQKASLDNIALMLANYDGDDYITASDALFILQKAVNKI